MLSSILRASTKEARKAGVLIGLENRDDLTGRRGSIPLASAVPHQVPLSGSL